MTKTKKPIPVEELPRFGDSEEYTVAVSEERLAAQAYERARATIAEASEVELFASNLKSGARTAAGAWLGRQVGSS